MALSRFAPRSRPGRAGPSFPRHRGGAAIGNGAGAARVVTVHDALIGA
jgi:hypothetical protein